MPKVIEPKHIYFNFILNVETLEIRWLAQPIGVSLEYLFKLLSLVYLKQITNNDLLHSTENPVQCYVVAWMGELLGGEWIPVYVWRGPFAIHLKLSQHCPLAIP